MPQASKSERRLHPREGGARDTEAALTRPRTRLFFALLDDLAPLSAAAPPLGCPQSHLPAVRESSAPGQRSVWDWSNDASLPTASLVG
jgi:hypothetical protein